MTIATSDDQTLDLNEPIAIVGMGCVYPGAKNTAEFWESIKSAQSYVKPLSKTEIPQLYDPSPEAFNKASCNLAAVVENFQLNPREFVGIPPHILHCLEESGRMALVAAQEALNQARISRLYPIDSQERAQSDKTFVSLATNGFDSPSHKDFVLSTFYDRLELLTQTETFKKLNISQQANLMAVLNRDFFKMDEKVSFDGLIQSVTTAVASRISKFNHFGGGHVSVDAACASSGYALDIAIKKLRNHSADRALVGGLGRLTTMIHVYCSKAQTMSTQGSFPFDERASGFVAGEGAGFVVLKRLKDALNQGDDIQAVIRGIGVSSDGSKTGPWAPNKEGQKLAVRRALRQTPYSIKHLQYIECHGTGTPVGDPEELSGIEELLKEVHATQKVTVGSGKAAVGHLLNGAGLVGLIRTVLAIQNKTFPPTANLRNPISFFSNSILEPLKTPRAWPAPEIDVPRRAMVNSFGFGGTNTNLQIEEFVPAFHRKYLNSNDPHFIRKIRSRQNISELSVTSNFSQIYNIPIAVVGIGLHLPGAKTTNEFENLLENGLSAITSMPKDRWGAELLEDKRPTDKWTPLTDKGGFVPIPTLREKLKWKIPPVVLEHLDPNQFRFFESVDEALAMAGLKNQKNILKDTALYCGVMCESDFMLKEEASLRVNLLLDFIRDKLTLLDPKIAHSLAEEFFEKLKPFLNEFNGDNSVSGVDSMLGARIAKFYDMLGGAAAMDNVCSTASNVLDHAINCLRSGDIEAAVVGSSNMAMSGHVFSMYSGLSHIAKEGSVRPFDKARSGTLLGEGAVTFVLRRLDDALASGQRVLALLHDASVGSDGHSNQMIAPTLEAIKDVMSRALISTSVTDVDYVECQGMGISTGDDLEVQAVDDLIGVQRRSRPVVIGSLKGSIGHLRVAGGFAALAKTILSIQQGKLYPTVGFQNPSEALASRLERVNVLTTPRPFHTRFPIAMINVYGVGGGHGAIVVGAYNAQLWTRQDQLPRPQLDIHFSNFGPNLEYKKQVLEKLRPQLHTDVAREILFKSGIYVVNPELKNHSKSAFVFSGQSSAYLGMYKTLVNSEPIFKELLRFADLKANKWGMKTFSDLLYDSGTESELANLFYTNFISCIFQIASFKYLTQKENIEPHLFVGHSLGEFAAAICAGALSVEDGFDVLYDRFNCLSKIKSQGKMAALRCTEEVARELIRGIAQLHLANFNLPEQIVIAGTPKAIQMAQTRAIHMGVDLKVLSASHAYHSPILQDAVEPFRKLLEDRSMKNLDVPVTSFVTNEIVFESKHLPTLLAEGFVSPVHFGKLISRALDFGIGHFVDMGPSWSSHRMVQKHLHNLSGNRPTRSYYLNHPKEDDRNSLKRFSEEFQFCNSNLETLSKGSHPVLSGSREQIGAKAANIWNKSTQDYSWFESRLPSGFDERTRICHKNLIKFLPSEYLQELHSLARQSSLPNQDVEYLHAMNSSLTMKYGLCSGFMTWTTAGKIVHGANYDLPFVSARDQDLFPRQVIEIRAEGKIPFIGVFKQGLLLPLCGVNARGIAVSYAAAPHHADFGNGINATTLVRIILENSNSLADVKQIVESYTYESSFTLLASSQSEQNGCIWEISTHGSHLLPKQTQCYANHFQRQGQHPGSPDSAVRLRRLNALVTERLQHETDGLKILGDQFDLERQRETKFATQNTVNRSNTGISCLFSTGLAAFSTSQIPSGRGPFLKHDFRDRSPNGHAINRWVWSCGEAFTTLPKDGADRPVEMLGDVRNHNFNGFLIDFRFCQMPDISFLKEDFSELIEFSRDIRRRLAKGSLQRLYVFLHAPQSLQPNLSNSPIIEAVRSLLLTISREYPDFKLHIILTPNPVTSNQALQAVQRLIMIHELPVECILFANKLYRRVLIPAPVTPIGATIDFDGDASNEGYLITGGAGGITAEIGIQTALKKGGRFLLVGRSSLPEAIDRRDRQQFFSEVRHQYANLKPVEYQRLWEKHSRSQATFKNIQRYRAVGAKVTYVQADLSTNEGLNKLSTAISSFGKIDHLIHGAGVERSKRFLEKGQEEFESILALKSLVTQRLLRLLPSDIKSLTLFGSVASITGSVGQSDYSAANAIHFAAASRLHQDFPRARIKSIAWPAWDEVGMAVNESVHGAMKDKGLSFLSVQDGCDFFSRELLLNTDAVVATLPGDRATADPFWYRATLFGIGERLGPVIDRIVLHTADELITEKLFTGQESVLKDHIIRGFPTLPGVTLTEMVLESAQLLQKDPSRIIIEEIVFDSPAVVSRPTSFRVRLKQNGDYWIVRLTSTKTRSDGYLLDPEYLHAHARVSLNGLIHARPTKKELPRKSLRGKREFYELLYSVFPEKLGITYQNLDKVVFKNDSQVMGLAQLSEECDFVGPGAITNGAIFDLMNQIMAEFATRPESTYIPKSFKKVRSFAPFVSGSTYWVENSNVSISSSELTYETHFWDESGDLILHVQEVNQAHYQRRKVEHA